MSETYKYKTFQITVSKDGEKPVFGNIQKELAERIKEHGSKGWRLISITPINSGILKHETEHHTHQQPDNFAGYGGLGWGWGTGWGAGYGYTSHLIITMEKQG